MKFDYQRQLAIKVQTHDQKIMELTHRIKRLEKIIELGIGNSNVTSGVPEVSESGIGLTEAPRPGNNTHRRRGRPPKQSL